MNLKERQSRILGMLRESETVEIGELCRSLDASRETVRKDLYELERKGLLTKVRGGAVLTSGNSESAYDLRKGTHAAEKQAIARVAASLVKPGDTVFLDYGTTTFMLASEFLAAEGITVVTNALPIVLRLLPNTNLTVMIPGGIVRLNEKSLYGPLTVRNMEHLFMNIGFFGCGGVDARAGITNHNIFETSISSLGIEQCQRVVVLADHSKLNVVAANKTADLDQLDLLITDHAAPADAVSALLGLGVAVQLAPRSPTLLPISIDT